MDLKNLSESNGWKIMVQVLEANIAYIDEQIISKQEPESGKLLTEDEVDHLRKVRKLQQEVINKPEELQRLLQREEPAEDTLDPYESSSTNQ